MPSQTAWTLNGSAREGERVVEAVGAEGEVWLQRQRIPVRVHKGRRILNLGEERAVEDDREPLPRREREIGGRVGILPEVLAGRGVGHIRGGEEDRGCKAAGSLREEKTDGQQANDFWRRENRGKEPGSGRVHAARY